jgi:hypothetical protein
LSGTDLPPSTAEQTQGIPKGFFPILLDIPHISNKWGNSLLRIRARRTEISSFGRVVKKEHYREWK